MVSILEKEKSINICCLTQGEYEKFYNFEYEIKKDEKDLQEIKKSFKSLVLNNPLLTDKSNPNVLIAVTSSGEIIGKLICSPNEFYIKGNKIVGFYYHDFFVCQDYRRKGIGTLLVEEAVKKFNPAFIIPINNISIKIPLALKFQVIGTLRKFVYLSGVNKIFKIFAKPILKSKEEKICFPEKIPLRECKFNLIKSINSWDDCSYFTSGVEFARTFNFLNWHISINPNKYYFYISNDFNSPIYFVLRNSIWRGLKVLEIVDYRSFIGEKDMFNLILKASKFLVKGLNLDGVITMSTHSFFDTILKKNSFISGGEPLHVLTNIELDILKSSVKNRELLFATMTDL